MIYLQLLWKLFHFDNSKYNFLSNESIKKITLDNKNKNKKIVYWNPTPKMSSYLLCIAVGDIVPTLSNPLVSITGTKINGYGIRADTKYLEWSINVTLNALEFYENWFGIKYPLDKLDIVSIPNFSA